MSGGQGCDTIQFTFEKCRSTDEDENRAQQSQGNWLGGWGWGRGGAWEVTAQEGKEVKTFR